MSDAIILEAAARALMHSQYPGSPNLVEEHIAWYRAADKLDHRGSHIGQTFEAASAVLAAVTPLIRAANVKLVEKNVADLVIMTRAAALEEAAVAAEEWAYAGSLTNIATAIRALKEQP